MQTVEVYPAEMLCLVVIAHGSDPMATLSPEASDVPHEVLSESTHDVTGQSVVSRGVKNVK